MEKHEPKICPKCGKDVCCTLNSNCWCFNYDIPNNIMEYVKMNYEGCLCENCIKELLKK